MNLWSINSVENENYIWKLNDSFDISSLKTITLWCNDIEWIETYSYEDENGQNVQINKNHCFDNGTITIPIESESEITLFNSGSHQFSIYDIDGHYSFLGGYYYYKPDQESLIDLYGDDIFEDLDNIGSDSNIVLLSGKIIVK